MNIKEILDLTNSMNIATIAKERLSIGEKNKSRFERGRLHQPTGKKGWQYKGTQLCWSNRFMILRPANQRQRAKERTQELMYKKNESVI